MPFRRTISGLTQSRNGCALSSSSRANREETTHKSNFVFLYVFKAFLLFYNRNTAKHLSASRWIVRAERDFPFLSLKNSWDCRRELLQRVGHGRIAGCFKPPPQPKPQSTLANKSLLCTYGEIWVIEQVGQTTTTTTTTTSGRWTRLVCTSSINNLKTWNEIWELYLPEAKVLYSKTKKKSFLRSLSFAEGGRVL